MSNGNIPVLTAVGDGLADAWEQSVLTLYREGRDVSTQYDAEGDPPSKDATMIMTVLDPMSEPAIHRGFPGGLEDLEEYRQEVVDGIKDHWLCDPNVPTDTRWTYTYHGRMRNWGRKAGVYHDIEEGVDQMAVMIEQLADCPYTRRAQMVIWDPRVDQQDFHSPCLQSVWVRALEDGDGYLWLNMNMRFRSRDAYDAAFVNTFAFISLMLEIADQLSDALDRTVMIGRLVDISDSYHIYGSRLRHFEENFLKIQHKRSFEDRTWTRKFAKPHFADARKRIAEKVAVVDAERNAR